MCEHLQQLEQALIDTGIAVTFRGKAWSENCREWVYFDCILNHTSLRERFGLPSFVKSHRHGGTHDGGEAGFICTLCNDAIMGKHPKAGQGKNFA